MVPGAQAWISQSRNKSGPIKQYRLGFIAQAGIIISTHLLPKGWIYEGSLVEQKALFCRSDPGNFYIFFFLHWHYKCLRSASILGNPAGRVDEGASNRHSGFSVIADSRSAPIWDNSIAYHGGAYHQYIQQRWRVESILSRPVRD